MSSKGVSIMSEPVSVTREPSECSKESAAKQVQQIRALKLEEQSERCERMNVAR